MERIPVYLISGFLGAGKTTYLNHFIRSRAPKRIFVIENEVGKVNVDQNPEVARQHRISALPTVLVFRNGEEVDRLVGVQPARRYLEALQNEA